MSPPLSGIRGRVTLTVLAVSSCLFSLLGTIGFLQIANSGRDAIRERVTEVVDSLEAGLRAGGTTVHIQTPDGVEVTASAPSAAVPRREGEVRVERSIEIGGVDLLLVGRASEARLNESLRSLFRGLWIAIPASVIISGLMASLATRRALRPVAAITGLANTIGPDDTTTRVPVPDTGDEIERLASTVNDMLGRIASGRLAQRQFSSDAAHELRTPLMALQGELELIRGHPERIDAGLGERLDGLVARLGQRVDDLVLLSTLDERPEPHLQFASITELLRAEAAALTGNITVLGDEVGATIDPVLMARALRNLLANAQRHARAEAAATVTREDGRVWVHVDDDGPGVEPSQRGKVFQRFARLDEARSSDAGGAGLGLAIVASVAAAHGGGAEISTGPLGGARFSLWLPDSGDPTTDD